MRYICTSIVATFVLAGTSFAATINVPADYPTIQGAVDAAVDGDEVVVAPGTYTSSDNEVVNMLGKAITLRASGTPEETIIDGGTVRRGVVFTTNEGSATVLDGFTIMNCKPVVFSGWHGDSGAGVYCVSSSPTIRNCTIQNNETVHSIGAGIACNISSSPLIENCVITQNFYSGTGGGGGVGISCYDDSNPTILNCEISHNSCKDGAGIGCLVPGVAGAIGSSPTITGCTITNNTASGNGGGIFCEEDSNPTITSCTISNNVASSSGGGIFCKEDSNPTITGCTISGNTTNEDGGGIYCNGSSPTITGCTITGNTAIWSGGGIGCEWSDPAITDCTITDNTATGGGGGIYCYLSNPTLTDCTISGNISSAVGGGIYCNGSSPTITDCTISDNTANNDGGGVYSYNSSNPTLTDTLLCGNAPDAIYGPWTDGGGVSFYDDCFLDCNGNGVPDSEDIANFTSYDCDQNGVPDECQPDCDGDGWIDACDSDADVDGDGIPDNCETDCNGNTIPDDFEIENGWAQDCNGNLIPDECDIANDPSLDCDGNGALDSCEIEDDQSLDCNGNGTLDACDLGVHIPADAVQWTAEEGGNGHWYAAISLDVGPGDFGGTHYQYLNVARAMGGDLASVTTSQEDDWLRAHVAAPEDLWQDNGSDCLCIGPMIGAFRDALGQWTWTDGSTWDYTAWHPGNPGEPQDHAACAIYWDRFGSYLWQDSVADAGSMGFPSAIVEWSAAVNASEDCNTNNIPDECDIADGTSNDANGNGIPDECEDDCNTNGVPDHWDIKTGTSGDCNTNGIPDECDTANGTSNDVNGNSIPDECEADCNDNGSPDDWDVVTGWSEDCNDNLIPDECELAAGESPAEGAVQWTVAEGGNGHWYQLVEDDDEGWNACRDAALAVGGDLCSHDTEIEDDFISTLVPFEGSGGGHNRVYTGAIQSEEGDWSWIDGSSWAYTNWHTGQPNGGEYYLSVSNWTNEGFGWDDHSENNSDINFYLIEWDLDSSASALDCNTNGIPDECDIADGTCEDINSDGVPDECQCLADIDGSGAVTIDDILAVIGYWGSSNPAADVNSDGIVNITDLLFIFDQWGPCP